MILLTFAQPTRVKERQTSIKVKSMLAKLRQIYSEALEDEISDSLFAPHQSPIIRQLIILNGLYTVSCVLSYDLIQKDTITNLLALTCCLLYT